MKRWLLASAITLPFLAMAAPPLADYPLPPKVLDPCPGASPCVVDPNLAVRTVVAGLTGPTSMAFLPNDDFDLDLLVLERRSGKVRHFRRDSPVGTTSEVAPLPLDLKVNSAGTRGLLGIALHPDFANPLNRWVYLFWTETTASMDSNNRSLVPVSGNRVDRYLWNGFSLTFDRNLINLRALQEQPPPMSDNQAPASHIGGVLRFGPDGKLYVAVGDVGRRGWMQNLECGTALLCPGSDDNLGGPQPDDKHLTGIILRLNDDGTTPK